MDLEAYKDFLGNTMIEHLGMEFTEIGDTMEAFLPVDHRTHQPAGLLHGGASAALIESLGSFGSALRVDLNKFNVVGIEINANHIKGVRSGKVLGKATIIHEGKRTHIWEGKIYNEQDELICVGRLTVMIVPKK